MFGLSLKELIIGTLLTCAGIFGFLSATHDVLLANKATNWPRTVGDVISVRSGKCKANQASLSLVYAFVVDQKRFVETTYSFTAPTCRDPDFVNGTVNTLRKTGKVTVAYNPADPAQCTIETGSDDLQWMRLIVISLVLILIGVLTLFFTADKSGHIRLRRKTLNTSNCR